MKPRKVRKVFRADEVRNKVIKKSGRVPVNTKPAFAGDLGGRGLRQEVPEREDQARGRFHHGGRQVTRARYYVARAPDGGVWDVIRRSNAVNGNLVASFQTRGEARTEAARLNRTYAPAPLLHPDSVPADAWVRVHLTPAQYALLQQTLKDLVAALELHAPAEIHDSWDAEASQAYWRMLDLKLAVSRLPR